MNVTLRLSPAPYRPVALHVLAAFVFSASLLFGQAPPVEDVRVAPSSLKIEALPTERKVSLEFRLSNAGRVAERILVSTGEAPGLVEYLPFEGWEAFADSPPPRCAWLVVIDNSDPGGRDGRPGRQTTVAVSVEEAAQFLETLPDGDSVMVATLARDLVVVSGFGDDAATRLERLRAIGVVPSSESAHSLTTSIYANLLVGMREHLEARSEARKAVLLFTNGKDETPGERFSREVTPEEFALIEERRKQAAELAKELGVAVHARGFEDQGLPQTMHLEMLKLLASETGGIYREPVGRRFTEGGGSSWRPDSWPTESWRTVSGAMHSGGRLRIDVSPMAAPAPIRVEFRTVTGREFTIRIPQEVVAVALGEESTPPTPPTVPGDEIVPGDDVNVFPHPPEEVPEALPSWIWWAALGFALLVLVFIVLAVSRRRRAEVDEKAQEERERQQAELLGELLGGPEEETEEKPAAPPPPPPAKTLAVLEMCDAEQKRIPLTRDNVRIGRGKHNDVVFANDSVSGNHCVINRRGEAWTITDLESGNGVVVRGNRVEKCPLHHGDTVELGDVKFRFLLDF